MALSRRLLSRTLAIAFAVSLLPALAVADDSPGLVLTGTLVDNGLVLPFTQSLPITVRLDRFTTDDEAAGFAATLRKDGANALDRALFGQRLGVLQIRQGIGLPIGFAREFDDDAGRHILLLVQRPISPREIFNAWRSVDYKYTVLEIDLAPDGRGSGEILPAAQLRMRKDGRIELVNLLQQPLRLLAVRKTSS
jgi:hypothetical protein